MKLQHFTLLFSILFLLLGGSAYQKNRYKHQLELEKRCIDNCVDTAVDAAAGHLAVYDNGRLSVDKEEALEAFLCNLYAGLGILDNIPAQQQILSYIPFLAVIDHEGYWLWHMAWETSSEVPESIHYWDAKVYFEVFEAQEKSRGTVLEDALKRAAEEYNIFSKQAGLKYQFLLPDEDDCLWLRGITEPGVLAFIQGMPLYYGKQTYSRFSFAGAVIHKRTANY